MSCLYGMLTGVGEGGGGGGGHVPNQFQKLGHNTPTFGQIKCSYFTLC